MIKNGDVIHDSKKKLDLRLMDSIQDLHNTFIIFYDNFFNKERSNSHKTWGKKNLLIYQEKIQLQNIF
jgi:hypothetical protein